MDNFLEIDADTFIHDKSIEIFKQLNHFDFDQDDVIIEKHALSGISNTIFKVNIVYKSERLKLENRKFTVENIFFKVFGRISVLVDRELETLIMLQLHELGIGPSIYETDMKTYRVEEFIEGCVTLEREKMLSEEVYPKMIKNFSVLNSFGDFSYYFDYVGDSHKSIFFEKLKIDPKTNVVNFTLNKMKPLGLKSFQIFKEKYENDTDKLPGAIDEKKLNQVEYILNNLEDFFYKTCPDLSIMVINHNDAHPLNILHYPNYEKVVLCDFEYSSYNFLGFDIANYLIETLFYLQADQFPFYQFFSEKNFRELKGEEYYQIYLQFFDLFEKEHNHLFEDKLENFAKIIEGCRTREYFYRMMGLSSLMWFVFAVIYYDYESIKYKSGYDYLSFSVDRLNVYDEFVRFEIN